MPFLQFTTYGSWSQGIADSFGNSRDMARPVWWYNATSSDYGFSLITYFLLFSITLSVSSETSCVTFLGCDKVLSQENPAGYNANEQKHNPESVVAKDRHFLDRCKTRPLETDSLYPQKNYMIDTLLFIPLLNPISHWKLSKNICIFAKYWHLFGIDIGKINICGVILET